EEDISGVLANSQWATSPSTRCAPGSLDNTDQCAGAVTSRPKVALRSGCSKTGKMRRASAGSHCEYKYSASSNGSTNRCKPSPVGEYGADGCTTSSFWACKSAKFNRAPAQSTPRPCDWAQR